VPPTAQLKITIPSKASLNVTMKEPPSPSFITGVGVLIEIELVGMSNGAPGSFSSSAGRAAFCELQDKAWQVAKGLLFGIASMRCESGSLTVSAASGRCAAMFICRTFPLTERSAFTVYLKRIASPDAISISNIVCPKLACAAFRRSSWIAAQPTGSPARGDGPLGNRLQAALVVAGAAIVFSYRHLC